MRKKVFGRALSRGGGARKALFRALVRALVLNGQITTTKAKAKAVQPDIDKLFGYIKKATVSGNRMAYATLGNNREILNILLERYAPVIKDRRSGFSRIITLPSRKGDMAKMARLELVDKPEEKKKEAKKEKKVVKKTVAKKVTKKIIKKPIKKVEKKTVKNKK
ncbi:MAG: 50S ribosomal protein L17 [Patescibacteria group bacterium]|mgnify:CR=1 FL=1